MSQENVGIMRDAYNAFERGEANVLFELLDPEIEWKSQPEEFIDDGDHVIAVVMERGRVPGSEEVVSQRFVQVWTLVDGKIRAFREYKTQREALDAAGLSE